VARAPTDDDEERFRAIGRPIDGDAAPLVVYSQDSPEECWDRKSVEALVGGIATGLEMKAAGIAEEAA